MENKSKILIVDDRVENLIALERILAELNVEFVRATSGNEALMRTLEHDFAIALIDVQMPEMDGFETVALMRQENRTRHLPVIFLSAIYKEDYYQIKGIRTGAVDFITKPVVADILIGKVKIFLELYRKEKDLQAEITRRIEYEKALIESEARQIRLNDELRQKVKALSASEKRLSRQSALLDGINRIFREALVCETEEAVAMAALAVAEKITASKFGFIGRTDVEGKFNIYTVSETGASAFSGPAEKDPTYLANLEIQGLWGRVLKSGRSLIDNKAEDHPGGAGFPGHHPPITTFLGVPLMQGKKVFGVFALANKEAGYSEKDCQAMEALGVAAVEALIRKRAEIELNNHRENLETLVEARTTALKESQAQLIQAEKTSALGTMVAGVAHELNNPLTAILQFTEYCIRKLPRSDRFHEILKDIKHETGRCIGIVEDLLTFSHSEKTGKEAFKEADLKEIIDRVLRLLSYRIGRESVFLDCQIPENARILRMMPGAMQQVILNLITNALDAVADRDQKEIRITVERNGEHLRMSVSDTGCGIGSKDMNNIFDPFFTTKPIGKATGLGLSITRNIVAAHQGEIRCQSRPGSGTKFTILIPTKQMDCSDGR